MNDDAATLIIQDTSLTPGERIVKLQKMAKEAEMNKREHNQKLHDTLLKEIVSERLTNDYLQSIVENTYDKLKAKWNDNIRVVISFTLNRIYGEREQPISLWMPRPSYSDSKDLKELILQPSSFGKYENDNRNMIHTHYSKHKDMTDAVRSVYEKIQSLFPDWTYAYSHVETCEFGRSYPVWKIAYDPPS